MRSWLNLNKTHYSNCQYCFRNFILFFFSFFFFASETKRFKQNEREEVVLFMDDKFAKFCLWMTNLPNKIKK